MPRLTVTSAVAATIVALGACFWIFFIGLKTRPEERRIAALALSSTGRWLATGTSAGRIYVWDQQRDQVVGEIREAHDVLNDLAFSPDERELAIANGNLTLVPIGHSGTAEALRDDGTNYGTVRFTNDNRAVLVVTGQGAIEVIDIATGRTILNACCTTIYGEVAFGADDTVIFNAGHNPRVWDARSGRLLNQLTKDREFYTFGPIAFDTRRNLVYMGSQDGRVYAWDIATQQLRARSPHQSGYVNTICVVGNSGWVAYAAFGGTIQMWNPESGEHRQVLPARTTSNLLFDTSSNLTLLGTNEGTVEFWDLIQSKIQRKITSPKTAP